MVFRVDFKNFLRENKVPIGEKISKFTPYLIPFCRKLYKFVLAIPTGEKVFNLEHEQIEYLEKLGDLTTRSEIKITWKPESREFAVVVVLTDSNRFTYHFDKYAERNWDLVLLDLRQNPSDLNPDGLIYNDNSFMTKSLLMHYLKEELLSRSYSYIAFIDDDLDFLQSEIDQLFNFGKKMNLSLFQPSLSDISEVNHANLAFSKHLSKFRSVPIVEIMTPFLSNELYLLVADLGMLSPSGWGLDISISHISETFLKKSPIVVDFIQFDHTRKSDPLSGAFYNYLKMHGTNPALDVSLVTKYVGLKESEILERNISNINNFSIPMLEIENFEFFRSKIEDSSTSKVAFLMTKDEDDILEVWIKHHLEIFDLLIILDDESDDKTSEILAKYKNRVIRILRHDKLGYIQREIVSDVFRYISEFRDDIWFFPLDTDEFVAESKNNLIEYLIKIDCHVAKLHWVNCSLKFNSRIINPDSAFFWTLKLNTENKIAAKTILARDGFEIIQGNHAIALTGSISRIGIDAASSLHLMHFPIRSKIQLATKLRNGLNSYSQKKVRIKSDGYHWKELQKLSDLEDADIANLAENYLDPVNVEVVSRGISRFSDISKLGEYFRILT